MTRRAKDKALQTARVESNVLLHLCTAEEWDAARAAGAAINADLVAADARLAVSRAATVR